MFIIILFVLCATVLPYYVAFGNVKIANAENHRNVVGGRSVASPHPYIHQVSLRLGTSHICGGSIIHNRKVLTAAHCVYKKTTKILTVVVGIRNLTDPSVKYTTKTIYIHENYNPDTITDDIALLITSKSIHFTDTVGPISIYGYLLGAGELCTAIGWGLNKASGHLMTTLQELNVTSLSERGCRHIQIRGKPPLIYTKQICVYNSRRTGLCNGDSGGPLMYNKELVGLVSWGRSCAVGFPDVFTRVFGYIDWIAEKRI